MSPTRWIIALLFATGFGKSQPPVANERRQFETASVKLWQPGGVPRFVGGPGTADPGRITWESVDLRRLLMRAYGVESDQISGPSWIDSEKYAVIAIIPPGTTQEHFGIILQNLLADRFRLALHHEAKELPVYELIVAKGGPRLAAAKDPGDPEPPPDSARERNHMTMDNEGCPVVPPGRASMVVIHFGQPKIDCHTFASVSMASFAKSLETFIRLDLDGAETHVIDKTGLSGQFAFKLKYLARGVEQPGSIEASVPGGASVSGSPGIYTAVEEQLGLRLQKTKDVLDRIVVDRAEKVPTEN